MSVKLFAGLALASIALSPHAATTITQFNFNSVTPDGAVGTGSIAPSTGAGSVSAVGGVATSFVTGGGGDTTASDNSALSTARYPANGSGDKTAGLLFLVSTVGYSDITFSYDVAQSATASRFAEIQYTTDGTTFKDVALVTTTSASSSTFSTNSAVLSSFAGTSNNANFGVRIVSTFAPGTTSYAANTTGSTYGTAGTARFDAVTFTGVAISAVPEADGVALSLAGFAALGALVRRRHAVRHAVQG